VEQFQRVVAIIYEVDTTTTWDDSETEEAKGGLKAELFERPHESSFFAMPIYIVEVGAPTDHCINSLTFCITTLR
jgi:hypothetical protein